MRVLALFFSDERMAEIEKKTRRDGSFRVAVFTPCCPPERGAGCINGAVAASGCKRRGRRWFQRLPLCGNVLRTGNTLGGGKDGKLYEFPTLHTAVLRRV